MKKLGVFVLLFAMIFVAVSCEIEVPVGVPEEKAPHFVLSGKTKEYDAIDVFTASGISPTNWAKSSTTDWPLQVIVKFTPVTPTDTPCFVKCFCDGYWPKSPVTTPCDYMAPATYHYVLAGNDSGLFRMQIQCLNEEQGLCTVKFASSTINLNGNIGKRPEYVGQYEVQIGTGVKSMEPGVDCSLENVFYSATITLEN